MFKIKTSFSIINISEKYLLGIIALIIGGIFAVITFPTMQSRADVPPVGGAYVTDIAAGGGHTCAIFNGGLLYCWGQNEYGQLGVGNYLLSETKAEKPVSVMPYLPVGAVVKKVSAGLSHTCAIVSVLSNDNQLYCWGKNDNGQLGLGTPSTIPSNSSYDVPQPVNNPVVPAFSGATVKPVDVSAGFAHTCALYNNLNMPENGPANAMFCWGGNDEGQLGNTGTVSANIPTAGFAALSGEILNISSGAMHTCATYKGMPSVTNNRLYCWGSNGSGQLGDNTTNPSYNMSNEILSSPTDVITNVVTGFFYSCAIVNNEAQCWGDNTSGQMGNGNNTLVSIPTIVSGILSGKTIKFMAGGYAHVCAVAGILANNSADELYCWGEDTSGQLADGNLGASSNLPVSVLKTNIPSEFIAKKASLGFAHTCVIYGLPESDLLNALYCAGQNDELQLGSAVANATSVLTPVDISEVDLPDAFITFKTDKSVELEIPDGIGFASAQSFINVVTNNPNGYQIFIASDPNNNLINQNDTSFAVVANSGSITSPTVLGNNKWGFAVANGTPNLVTNGFNNSYSSPDSNSLWAGVPNSEIKLFDSNQPTLEEGDTANIFYGAKVDINIMAGLYKGKIVYTAIPNI